MVFETLERETKSFFEVELFEQSINFIPIPLLYQTLLFIQFVILSDLDMTCCLMCLKC